jgi:undecaprenyl pyrophosphate phosphatase UppP
VSFIVAYFSIDLLLKWLKSHSMTPFVIYRIIFGSILLYITLQ